MTVRERSIFVTPWFQGTLVKAGSHRVLPIDVEEVRNDDGQDKQDGEITAAKRFIPRSASGAPAAVRCSLAVMTCTAMNRLFCNCASIGCTTCWCASPASHAEVYREVEAQDALGALERGEWHEGPACRRRFYTYRLARGVALTETGRVRGTFVEVWSHNRAGKQLYHNAWFTDL